MVVRARSFAAVLSGLAAFPLAAHASFSFGQPSFGCSAGDGSVVNAINWGDGSSLGAPVALVGDPTAVEFSCSNNMYSAGITGNSFLLNFGGLSQPPEPDLKYELKLDEFTGYKLFGGGIEGKLLPMFETDYDMYLSFWKIMPDGSEMFDHKDFVGLKLDSLFGFSTEGKFFMADGSVFLDPTIPGGNADLFLTDTPAVPEPATLALVGSGIAGGILRRKRKAKT